MPLARILIILISGISILYSQSYPMLGQNQHHTCHIDVAGPVTNPKERWKFQEKEHRHSANPVTDRNGNIYVGFTQDEIEGAYYGSLDSLGKVRWEKRLEGSFYSSDCFAALDESRNRAYFCCGGNLYAHSLNGEDFWIMNSIGGSPPTIRDNGYLYVNRDGNNIKCASPEGELVWEFEDYSGSYSLGSQSALDDSGHVYIPLANYLYCLNGDTGQKIWKVPLSGETRNGVTLGNNSIYYIDNGNFICRDFSGNEKWRYDGVGNNYNQAICAIQANGDIIVPGSQWLWGFTKEGTQKFRITMANFYSVITDKNNNIFAYFHGGYNVHDFACYNSQGDTLWTKSFTYHMPHSEMCLNVNGDLILVNFDFVYCYSTNTGFSSSTSSSYLPSHSLLASPNPFSTRLSISLPSSGAIYSLTGQLIMSLPKGKHSLDTSKWKEGVYVIKSGKECKRVVKVN